MAPRCPRRHLAFEPADPGAARSPRPAGPGPTTTPRRALAAAAALVGALSLPGCRDWRARVDPSRAAADPEQGATTAAPIAYEVDGWRIRLTPRAGYRVTAYVAETSRELLDEWDFAVPIDVALVWGPVARPEVLRELDFHLSHRYVSVRWDRPPPGLRGDVMRYVANHHLIPATDEVRRELDRVRVGDLLTLEGQLVDMEIRDAQGRLRRQARSSLVRDDVGSGACEQLWVESAARNPP